MERVDSLERHECEVKSNDVPALEVTGPSRNSWPVNGSGTSAAGTGCVNGAAYQREESDSKDLPAPADGELLAPTSATKMRVVWKDSGHIDFFDYDQVPEEHRQRLRNADHSIRSRLAPMARAAYFLGNELQEIKTRLDHGLFAKWVHEALGIRPRTAQRLMQIAERLGGHAPLLSNVPLTTLYDLTAKQVPDEAIEECLNRAKEGAVLVDEDIRSIVKRHRTLARAPLAEDHDRAAVDLLTEVLAERRDEFVRKLTPRGLKEVMHHLRQLERENRSNMRKQKAARYA